MHYLRKSTPEDYWPAFDIRNLPTHDVSREGVLAKSLFCVLN